MSGIDSKYFSACKHQLLPKKQSGFVQVKAQSVPMLIANGVASILRTQGAELILPLSVEPPAIYLHKQPVDFLKSINGLSIIVEDQMKLASFSGALLVSCNRQRDKLKGALLGPNGVLLVV